MRNRKSRFSKNSARDGFPRPQGLQNRKNQTQNKLAKKFSARIALRIAKSGFLGVAGGSLAKSAEPKNPDFQSFRPQTAPPGPRSFKIAKIRTEICLPTNSQPELPSEWQILGGPFPAAVSRRSNGKKKQRILTISPTKNPGNGTERRVLKSYHDGFQSQTQRCHLSQVMLISVLNKRFGVGIKDVKCLGELVWVSYSG